MEWAHLPWPGGLYDQHPKFVDDMYLIFQKKSEHEAQDMKRREAEQRKQAAAAKRR
jgi:hypothetical protein